jgi:hypothetical protein
LLPFFALRITIGLEHTGHAGVLLALLGFKGLLADIEGSFASDLAPLKKEKTAAKPKRMGKMY